MKLAVDDWDIRHLHSHLQAAAELEAWTIPFYVSAMYSIAEENCLEFQLIQSVANQEMLHLQLVGNIANAYGYSPVIKPEMFAYQGTTVPHLDFSLDPDNPAQKFSPYSAEIGPLDEERINAMCLIEFPEWETGGKPDFRDNVSEYGSIGEFYDALEHGCELLVSHVKGGVKQTHWFDDFYPDVTLTVTSSGKDGLAEVQLLMDVIRDQGEAAEQLDEIDQRFRSIKDDPDPSASHFQKFMMIRRAGTPPTYPLRDGGTYTPAHQACQDKLIKDFADFTVKITELLAGGDPDFSLMEQVGKDIQACWQNGVVPRFT